VAVAVNVSDAVLRRPFDIIPLKEKCGVLMAILYLTEVRSPTVSLVIVTCNTTGLHAAMVSELVMRTTMGEFAWAVAAARSQHSTAKNVNLFIIPYFKVKRIPPQV
jgi:hypothetical protein